MKNEIIKLLKNNSDEIFKSIVILITGFLLINGYIYFTKPATIPAKQIEFTEFDGNTNVNNEVRKATLYSSFIMDKQITNSNILDISRIIQVSGKIQEAYLIVNASTTDFGQDKTRRHTVYFYIDDEKSGGHIDAERKDGLITKGFFTINQDNPYNKRFDLKTLKLSDNKTGFKIVNVFDKLNDNKEHYVGAFAATGIYSRLDELFIEYRCDKDTPDCSINFIR